MQHPRQVLTRSVIFERVWEYDFGPTSNSLTVYIGYLRRKTEEGASRDCCTRSGASATLRNDPRAETYRLAFAFAVFFFFFF